MGIPCRTPESLVLGQLIGEGGQRFGIGDGGSANECYPKQEQKAGYQSPSPEGESHRHEHRQAPLVWRRRRHGFKVLRITILTDFFPRPHPETIHSRCIRTFVAPLERLKLEYILRGEQSHLFALIHKIATTQGLKGFWKGNLVNILRTAPFKAVHFCAYDTYRKQLLQLSGKQEITNFERFIAGAAAGITATVLCIPMDTVRNSVQSRAILISLRKVKRYSPHNSVLVFEFVRSEPGWWRLEGKL